jgi:hypothetical protein
VGATPKNIGVLGLAVLVIVACLLLAAGSVLAAPADGLQKDLRAPGVFTPPSTQSVDINPVGITTCTPFTDPSAIPFQTVHSFASDPEYSIPTTFPGGTFSGHREQIYVLGSSWDSPVPSYWGKHVYFVQDCTISFATPRQAVGVAAEPNVYGWFNITIQAFDTLGSEIGSFTRSIYWGLYGDGFLGLYSSERNIASVRLTAEPSAGGFVFADLTYDNSWGGFLSPLRPTDRKVFSNFWYRSASIPVKFKVDHTGTPPVTNLSAGLSVTGPGPSAATVFTGTFTYKAAGDYYLCSIPKGELCSWQPGIYTLTVDAEGGTYQVQIKVTPII